MEHSLESLLFKKDYGHKPKLVDRIIGVIKRGRCSEVTHRNVLHLVFRMMGKLVVKNSNNYQNLMRNSRRAEILPERDEVVSECFLVLKKCIDNFKVGTGYDFYFYYNKGLSRHFYRQYQNALRSTEKEFETTDVVLATSSNLRQQEQPYDVEFLTKALRLEPLERLVADSKIEGKNSREFLEEHPEITKRQYDEALRSLKHKASRYRNDE